MSKMFQSSGNLLQFGILSLFTSKSLNDRVRKRERERNEREKNDIELWVVTDLHSLVGTCRVSEECLCADADCLPSAAVFKSD